MKKFNSTHKDLLCTPAVCCKGVIYNELNNVNALYVN